jgi:hypothetical protein
MATPLQAAQQRPSLIFCRLQLRFNNLLRLLAHDDVNLFPAHERDHGSPLGDPVGDIVPCHSHGVIEVDINDFMLRISALDPGCHCCLPTQFESDTSAEHARIEFSLHTAAPREILQRFERGAHGAAMIDPRAERAWRALPLRLCVSHDE